MSIKLVGGWVCSNCGIEVMSLSQDEVQVGHQIPEEYIFVVRDKKYKRIDPKCCGIWMPFDEKLL